MPTYMNQFKCLNPECEKPFEPLVTTLSAEIVRFDPDLNAPERTREYREITVVICGSCDTVIGVLPD